MPTFLNQQQDRPPVYSPNAGVVHLDLDDRFGLARDHKVPGSPPPHFSSHNSNDSFDEAASSTSSNTSESSAQTRLNGRSSAGTTMTSTTITMNGKASRDGPPDVFRKPLPNGISSAVLVDRTVPMPNQQPPPPAPPPQHQPPPQPLSNGTRDRELSPAPSLKDGHQRASMASTNGGESIQQSPVELQIRPVNKGDVVTVHNSNSLAHLSPPGHSLANAPSQPASPAPTTLSADGLRRNHSTPHRFSSPPHYSSLGATPNASTSALSPPAPGIKHRHTLEVPKVGPSRSSRDSAGDAAYASGRFSPTVGSGRRASLSLGRRNTRSLHSDMPRDGVIPDDDALRWTEAYRQKRATKRKRLEEDDDRVLVGTKVDETHANWVAAYNMLTGIRVSVSRTNAKLDRPLTDEDFEAKQKSTFDISGNELVPSAKYDFKFKDYAPWVFRRLRAMFGLDPADYLMSLTGKYILSELGSPGKSGSFFYFSRDYKYIIKTIHHGEHKFLRKILKEYFEHASNNPNTLLSQFYGLHRVKVPYGRKIHFVVMNNLFPPHRDIHQTFDLKGSTIGRDYKEDNLGSNPRATLKDLNWLRRQRHLELGIQKKQLFLEQLRKDVALLQRLKIMDYSLLIGIHDLRRGNEENLRQKTLQVFNPGGSAGAAPEEEVPSVLLRTPSKLESARKARELRQMLKAERPIPMASGTSVLPEEMEEDQKKSDSAFYQDDGGFQATHEDNSAGDEIYYLGVIDCLTHYGMIKKIEHFWKGLTADRTQISALPPDEYGERFFNFMSGITLSPEEAARAARDRDARLQAEAAAAETAAAVNASEQREEVAQEKERTSTWGSAFRRKRSVDHTPSIPPVPTHQPPPIPGQSPPNATSRPPEVQAVMRRAEHEAFKRPEEDTPQRVLHTTTVNSAIVPAASPPPSAPSGGGLLQVNSPVSERRESAQGPVLAVVDEAGEGSSSTGGRSRSRNSKASSRSGLTTDSERPLTPAKDGAHAAAGFGIMSYTSSKSNSRIVSPAISPPVTAAPPAPGHPPPTPPKSSHNHNHQHHLKPAGSTDSGYGVGNGNGLGGVGRTRSTSTSRGSLKNGVKGQISRDSLDKALPPLPPPGHVTGMERA